MLINLSSQNETNPAQFTNHLSDAVDIKPFSYICLVKGQVFRTKEKKQITVPPDTVMYVRWTAYDVGTLTLNSGGASNLIFTVAGLVQYVNGLWGQLGFPAGYVLELIHNDPVGVGNDERVDFKFLANVFEEGVVDFRWKDEVYAAYGGTSYWQTKWGQCRDDANALVPFMPQGSVPGNNYNIIQSAASAWAAGVIWDTATRTSNTNQINKDAFGLLTTETLSPTRENGYTPMQFFVQQQNVQCSMSFGISTTNTNDPIQYVTGPYHQSPNFDPTSGYKHNILTLNFNEEQGKLGANVWNADSNSFERNLYDVNPGDYFEIYSMVDHEGAIDMVDPQRAFYMNVNHFHGSGLVFAYDGNLGAINDRPGSNNFQLDPAVVESPTANVMSNMSFCYTNEHLKSKYYKQDSGDLEQFYTQWRQDFGFNNGTSWLTNAFIGTKAYLGFDGAGNENTRVGTGWVYSDTGYAGTKPFASAYADGTSDMAQWRYATGCWGFMNQNGQARNVGDLVEIPNVYAISADEIPCSHPTLLCGSIMFNILAQGMYPPGAEPNVKTIIGGTNNKRLLEFQLNQANNALPGGWDARITQNDTTTLTGLLIDGNGQRIDFSASNNVDGYTYNYCLRYYGQNTNRVQLSVIVCTKTAAGHTFGTYNFADSLVTTGALQSFNSVGGVNAIEDNTLNNYNDYSPLSYICNIRLFQKNAGDLNSEAMWDNEVAGMTSAFSVIPSYAQTNDWWTDFPDQRPSSIEFYPHATSSFIVPTVAQGNQDQYNNVGFPNSVENVGVFLSKAGGAAPVDPADAIFSSMYVPANQILQQDRRNTALSAGAYAGIGVGLVDVDLPDTRGIGDVLYFEIPEPDANDNVLQVPRVLPPNPVPPNDWVARITADADVSTIENEQMNVEITNLPHTSLNATNGSIDKTIYQLPMIHNTEEVGSQELVEMTPPSKVWIPLNNPGSLPLNRLNVKISAVDGRPITTLLKDTHITIQIEHDKALLN